MLRASVLSRARGLCERPGALFGSAHLLETEEKQGPVGTIHRLSSNIILDFMILEMFFKHRYDEKSIDAPTQPDPQKIELASILRSQLVAILAFSCPTIVADFAITPWYRCDFWPLIHLAIRINNLSAWSWLLLFQTAIAVSDLRAAQLAVHQSCEAHQEKDCSFRRTIGVTALPNLNSSTNCYERICLSKEGGERQRAA